MPLYVQNTKLNYLKARFSISPIPACIKSKKSGIYSDLHTDCLISQDLRKILKIGPQIRIPGNILHLSTKDIVSYDLRKKLDRPHACICRAMHPCTMHDA